MTTRDYNTDNGFEKIVTLVHRDGEIIIRRSVDTGRYFVAVSSLASRSWFDTFEAAMKFATSFVDEF